MHPAPTCLELAKTEHGLPIDRWFYPNDAGTTQSCRKGLTLFAAERVISGFLPKISYLGFPRSVLPNPKPVRPGKTSLEHIWIISLCHRTVQHRCDSSRDTILTRLRCQNSPFLAQNCIFPPQTSVLTNSSCASSPTVSWGYLIQVLFPGIAIPVSNWGPVT